MNLDDIIELKEGIYPQYDTMDALVLLAKEIKKLQEDIDELYLRTEPLDD